MNYFDILCAVFCLILVLPQSGTYVVSSNLNRRQQRHGYNGYPDNYEFNLIHNTAGLSPEEHRLAMDRYFKQKMDHEMKSHHQQFNGGSDNFDDDDFFEDFHGPSGNQHEPNFEHANWQHNSNTHWQSSWQNSEDSGRFHNYNNQPNQNKEYNFPVIYETDNGETYFNGGSGVRTTPVVHESKASDKNTQPETQQTYDYDEVGIAGVSKTCGRRTRVSKARILGGRKSKRNEWPWLVRFHVPNRPQPMVCGGTLITRQWVLSAAHCFLPRPDAKDFPTVAEWRATVGEHDTTSKDPDSRMVKISATFVHPEYDYKTFENDIALVRLSERVEYSFSKKVGCLTADDHLFLKDKGCYVAGWGLIDNVNGDLAKQLRHTSVKLMDNEKCAKMWGDNEDISKEKWRKTVLKDETFICAMGEQGETDACQGDSGGPLMCVKRGQFVIFGIISNGFGCADPLFPGVYTRVSKFLPWIQQTLALKS